MKCPKCGFTNNRPGTRCLKCGAPFLEQQQQLSIEPEPIQQTQPSVPDWRKEVTRKAREFGERKKILTTPPRPLKGHVGDHEPSMQHEPILPRVEVSTATIEPEPTRIRSEVFPPPLKTSPQPLIREPQPRRRLELDLEEFLPPEIELESDTTEEHPLNIGRRSAALFIDHAILIGLAFAVMFFFREMLTLDLQTKFESGSFPIIGAMLLFHFLYYFYFHTTSRQTPGQVFLSLEVRNPSGGSISGGKVFGRWAALVFLNVFNLVPFFLGKKFLLLDQLSGTEVRSFKEKS
ncbi:RDD family protein [bacterium]|nr:RDD family protein [bacterium]